MKRLAALGLSMVLLLTGCGRSEQAYVPTGDGLSGVEAQTQPTETGENGEKPRTKLTYYPNITMNPYTCTDDTNRTLFSLLYQGLFSVDREYRAEPVLCRKFAVTDDLKTYIFYLDTATFSDGEPVEPEDVVASLKAAEDSPYYGGRFHYFREISVTADRGVLIKLSTPYENLPLLLDIPIVKQEDVEDMYPLGTGPYIFTQTAVTASLQKRENWWCKAKPVVQENKIPLVPARSVTQIRDAFEFEGLSLVRANPGSDRYVDYRCDYELWDCESGDFLYITICKASKIFEVPEVQAALTHAIDRDYLAENFYRGFARPASLPASPVSPFYSQALASHYGFNSAVFKKAVADAGLVGSPVVIMVNSEDSLRVRVAKAIGKMLEDCGLVPQVQAISGDYYLSELKKWNFDLYVGQTKLSPTMDLTQFFSDNGLLSWGGVNDVAIYALCQQALENHGNYYTLHKAVMETSRLCPILFCSHGVYATRGLMTSLTPSRDNVFYYTMNRSMEDAKMEQMPQYEPVTEPSEGS